MIRTLRTNEFKVWFESQRLRVQGQIDARISKIEEFEYFGDVKNLNDGLLELRWTNGRRVYFSRVGNKIILLLVGGYKNAQKKDIQKARLLLVRYSNPRT